MVGAPVAAGAEGILFRGSITRAGIEAEVAIKMLQPRFLPRVDEWRTAWYDQVHVLRSTRCSGVVAVREGFLGPLPHPPGKREPSQTLYLVMDWVDGEPLDEWVRRRPDRDPFEALKLLLAVSTALDLMHSGHFTQAPVVHRDVKPANILVTDEGTVLVDFGLTCALPDGPRYSGVIGTAGYLAPEATDDGVYTPATDRYALGAVAYFVFTGTEPPQTHQPEVLRKTLQGVPALAERPDAVDHLMAMLDADPDLRPYPLSNWVGQVRRSTLDDPPGMPSAGQAESTPSADGSTCSVQEINEAVYGLTEALMSLESSNDVAFVRSQTAGEGRMAQRARTIAAELDQVWLRYPLVREIGDRLDALGANGDAEARHLLGPDAITLPSGTTMSVRTLTSDLHRSTDDVAAAGAALVKAAVKALSHLEAAEATVEELRRRAATVGVSDDVVLTSALRVLMGAKAALFRDLSSSTADLDEAIAEATRSVEELEEMQRAWPERLSVAHAELANIERLIVEGAEAFTAASEKILRPQALRPPRHASELDGDGQQLRPWLDRIEGDAGRSRLRAADDALRRWMEAASAFRVEAENICVANQAPVAARNELRGLLGAYRTMAGTMGKAEDPVLCRLHEDASDALYVAPCDLALAERLVRIYIETLNGNPPDDRP